MRQGIKFGFALSIVLLLSLIFCTSYNYIFIKSDPSDKIIKNLNSSQNNTDSLFQKASQPLNITTYDGSGQLTHPSVLYFPKGWNQHKYWAAATPFPNADDRYENPSIYCFDTPGEAWIVPARLKNPIILKPSEGFNSDPCLIYNRTSDELYCFYREYNYTDLNFKYFLVKSSDGISWSDPILLYKITSDKPIRCSDMPLLEKVYTEVYTKIYDTTHKKLSGGTNNENSNSIVQLPNGTWMMWAQKWGSTNVIVYRTSNDCLNWSEPKNCIFLNNSFDSTLWHLEVKYIPENNHFLMIQYSYVNKYLTLSESKNGIVWKYYSDSILNPDCRNTTNFASSHLYKSSFTYDPTNDSINLWYTGVNSRDEWRIGYTNTSYLRLQNFVNQNIDQ